MKRTIKTDPESAMLAAMKVSMDIMTKETLNQKIASWIDRAGYSCCASWRDMPDDAVAGLAAAMHKHWEEQFLGDW